MQLLSRGHLWVADLIGLAIGAAVAGHAAGTFFAGFLPQAAPPSLHRAPEAARPTSGEPDKSIEGIVDRDIFCSACGDAPLIEASQRPLTLLAIMFSPSHPRWSIAVVRDEASATSGPYGVGARLDDATIAAIEPVRVVLVAGDGRRELLELLAPTARQRGAGGARAPAIDGGVRKTGPRRYEVRRAVVDELREGGLAPPWPRAVPETRDGVPIGVRLFGVRPDSPFTAIGLQNGDTLLQVNGRSLTTPDAALAAYAALRSETHVWLVVERGGRSVRFDYVIR